MTPLCRFVLTIPWTLVLVGTLLAVPVRSRAQRAVVVSGHPAYPPFMWRDGERIAGFGARLAQEVLSRLNIPFQNRYTGPWARVQDGARKGRVDLIVGLYYNEDRAGYLHYTSPYKDDPVAVFVRRGKAFPYRKWADLVGRAGTTMQGESFGVELDAFMKKHLTLSRGYDPETNFKRLLAGHAEYFLWGYYPGMVSSRVLGIEGDVEALPFMEPIEKMYIGISKKSPLAARLPEINRVVEALVESGQVERWADEALDRYVKRKGARPVGDGRQ